MQFRGSLTRELINRYRTFLGENGFNAPGAERIAENYRSLVKYFNAAGRDAAMDLAAKTQAFFESQGCPLRIEAISVDTKISPVPPLEVWLHYACGS